MMQRGAVLEEPLSVLFPPLKQQSAVAFNHLSDSYPSDPEVHGPGIVTAQVFDVLRLLLYLRMLDKQIKGK